MNKHKQYKLRDVFPATGYSAVWSFEEGDHVVINVHPLDFLAIRDVLINHRGKEIIDDSELVGIELLEGYFDIVTDLDNCHGIVRDESTWSEWLELVPSEVRDRIVMPPVFGSCLCAWNAAPESCCGSVPTGTSISK